MGLPLNPIKETPFSKAELGGLIVLFVFIWAYLIVRAKMVFFIHDEIVTKWAYMIDWNPFPYMGYVDSNNHFVNSLLGGGFIRLFNSDSQLVIRLASLLAFPLYFWAIVGFRKYFKNKNNFYLFVVLLTCTSFIIEFFQMARGYGMSMAFMVFALLQTLEFFSKNRAINLIGSLLAWILAIYANMTLIPMAIVGLVYLIFYVWKTDKRSKIWVILPALIPIGYAIKYMFYLKGIGKLYYGNREGIIDTTLHSLTPYIWNIKSYWFDAIIIGISIVMLVTLFLRLIKEKDWFDFRGLFTLFFIAGVVSILLQNWLLGINFPEDRTVLYMVVFFYGGLSFTIDYWNINWIGTPLIILTLFLFSSHFNFSHFNYFSYEHMDKKLFTSLPDQVLGIPPSTGARFWNIDNEISRDEDIPLRAFQLAEQPLDTLNDYILLNEGYRSDILGLYHPFYVDTISSLIMYERNQFLSRSKIGEKEFEIATKNMYYDLYVEPFQKPLFIRCKGKMDNMSIFKNLVLIFSAENTKTKESIYYQGISLVESASIAENGDLTFDFTVTFSAYENADMVKFYVYNQNEIEWSGHLKIEVYEVLNF